MASEEPRLLRTPDIGPGAVMTFSSRFRAPLADRPATSRRGQPVEASHAAARVLILGSGDRARRIAKSLEASERFSICGFLDDDPTPTDRAILGDRYLGPLQQLSKLSQSHQFERVVCGLPRRFLAHGSTANAIGVCEMLGIDVTIPMDLFDSRVAELVRQDLPGLPAFTLSVKGNRSPWKLAAKRGIDIAGALIGIVLAVPIWLIVALAIKLDSSGPIFFVQPRCGRHGRTFQFLKFRTMYQDAEEQFEVLRALNEQSGPVFKMRDDPRVTRVGRWLRKLSIDELPQLINVVRGEMSLVGPRPAILSEVLHYQTDHRGRLSMRPGLTCLWQVAGRNQIEFEDWVKLDLEYVDRWSLILDLQILLATIPAVLSGRGAS